MGIQFLHEIEEEAGFFLTFDQIMMLYLCVWLAIFGLIWGSFADCAVARWAMGERMFGGRSRCLSCDHVLGPLDLIPVVSFLVRRGRCHYCGEKIPAECLLAELLGAAGFVCVGLRFGSNMDLVLWALVSRGDTRLLALCLPLLEWVIWWAILLAVTLTDAAKRIIPDQLVLALAANRVVWFFVLGQDAAVILEALKAMVVPLVLLALVLAGEKLLDRELMGGGDIKLLLALALYLSWAEMLLTLLAGCIAGLAFAVLARRKRGTALPFGPFLAAGALVTVCFGEPLIAWYFGLF